MTLSMAGKFAWQNLKANKLLEIPFILSTSVMFILFNIMASLLDNEYVKNRHIALTQLMSFGVILVAVFTFIFAIYTTNILLKRRNKEFALYGILGLEKKHIRKIISIEFFVLLFVIGVISVLGGYIFGQLSFLGLNRLMKDVSGGLMHYPFSMGAMTKTWVLIALLYVITVIRSSFRIYLSTPVQLLGRQHSGEGEPKARVMVMIVGFIALIVGYYIALTTKGILTSLLYFFIAALLVMIATYMLYISFSVVILKAQKRKSSYYKASNFLRVSGLLHRIKSNGISLASISILSVGVILTISVTATIYSNIQTMAKNVMPREYQIESKVDLDENNYKTVAEELKKNVEETVYDKSQISDGFTSYTMITTASRVGDEFKEYTGESHGIANFILVYDLDSYNARTKQHLNLQDDEALLCVNQSSMADMETIKIGERSFKVSVVENIVPSNYAVEVYCLVVKDFKTMQYISSTLKTLNFDTKKMESAKINCVMDWDIKGIKEKDYKVSLKKLEKNIGDEVGIRTEFLKSIYEMDGGFLFLGIIIGLVFLTGTTLITYYKQISEGYEDRENYQIMKKVGLSDELIKKTSASQIVWMFFAPLAVAVIHCLVASKIVYQMLGLFAIQNFMQYGIFFLLVIGIFFVIYYMIFKLTSGVYYRIVQ